MSATHVLAIVGQGLISALGADLPSNRAAFKAGISGYQDSIYFTRADERAKACFIPDEALPPLISPNALALGVNQRQRRSVQMAAAALSEALTNIPLPATAPLFLAGPEPLPSAPANISPAITLQISEQLDVPFDYDNSRIFLSGRVGGIQAIDMAYRYFDAALGEFALVGGVEARKFALAQWYHYEREGRLLSRNASQGFVPGEGACFLTLCLPQTAAKYQLPIKGLLYRPSLEKEDGHRYSPSPQQGNALAGAIRQAATAAQIGSIAQVFSSLNGEIFSVKELGIAMIRNKNILAEQFQHNHPADCFGDLGAATSLANIVLAQSHRQALIIGEQDGPRRGAIITAQP